jgi:hypothetical protein
MDVVNIKISKFGGLTKARQARDLCVSLGVAMTLEDSWGGDIVTATPDEMAGAAVFQFFVGVYGGYFGAGIGILMLAALAILGVVGIHRMNGLKNLFALCINGSAALYFLAAGMVHWRYALLMAVGAIVGGYACAGFARRMSAQAVRRVVILIGLGMALSLLIAKK